MSKSSTEAKMGDPNLVPMKFDQSMIGESLVNPDIDVNYLK